MIALLLLVTGMVHADPYPPYWEGGFGGAVEFQPVAWPAEGDGENAFGGWTPYTYNGDDRGDHAVQDPSNGGTSPQNYVNISSGCTDESYPSSFWHFDAANQVFMYRWRVQQIANTYAVGPNPGAYADTDPWKSALWTVLIDTDGDGWREFAMHLDGSSGAPGAPVDRMVSIWSNTPSNSIDYVNDPNIHLLFHNPAAFVDGPVPPDTATDRILNFQSSVTPTASWPNGASETVWDYGTTRAVLVTHYNTPGVPASGIWCQEYFIDYQIPLAMLDATAVGGPAVTPDTPFCAAFASSNSLNNPFQKDVLLTDACVYTGDPSGPIPCGDVITVGGGTQPQPLVNDISATGCSPTIRAHITDSLTCASGTLASSITSVGFYSYFDANSNGLPDDGSTWSLIGAATLGSDGAWTASWTTTSLPVGLFLIGVRAQDGQGNITWSYLPNGETPLPGATPPNYGNPAPVPGLTWATFLNSCGTRPSASKSASVSEIPIGGNVQFTITLNASQAAALTVTSVTDALPPGWSYVSTNGGSLAPTCNPAYPPCPTPGATGDITWNISAAAIPAGGSGTLVFTAKAPMVTGTYTNVATAATSGGPLPTDPVQVAVGAPRLTIAKVADASSYNPGQTISYTITYSNDSPVTVTNAFITDSVPAGTVYVGCSSSPVVLCSQAGGVVTWTIGTLAAGEGPYTATMQVTVQNPYPPTAPIPLVNTATVDSDQTTPQSASAYSLVNSPRPSLAIQKRSTVTQVTPAPPLPPPGANVTFTVDYFNTGNAPAYNVVITDPIPIGWSYVGCTPVGCANVAGVVTWTIGTVAAGSGGSVTVILNADPGIPNPSVNTAYLNGTVDSGGTIPLPQGQDSWTIRPTQGSCSSPTTYYLHGVSPPMPGTADTTSGTGVGRTVQLSGPATQAEFASFYQVPTPTQVSSLTSATTTLYYEADKGGGSNPTTLVELWEYDPATSTRVALIGSGTNIITGRASYTLTWSAAWSHTLPANRTLLWVFRGTVAAGRTLTLLYDGDVANRADSRYTVCPNALADVVDKSASSLVVTPGGTLTYTVDFGNPSVVNLTNARMVDTLPTGVTFVSATLNGVATTPLSVVGQVYTFGVQTSDLATPANPPPTPAGTLTAGRSGTLTVTVNVANPIPDSALTLVNSATLRTNQVADLTDTATTTVVRPRLAIIKSASDTLLYPGDVVTFTLAVSSFGNANATNLTITDDFPNETWFTYVGCSVDTTQAPSAPPTTCSQTGGVLTATAAALNTGETLRVSFQMLVTTIPAPPAGLTERSNTATVSTATTGAVTSNTVTVVISTNPNLQLTKSVVPATSPRAPGDTLTYTLVVTNTGSATATEVVVTDPIPAYTGYVFGSMTYQSVAQTDAADADSGRFDALNNRVAFDVGDLLPGASRTTTFQVLVDDPLPHGTTALDNTATATSSNTAAKQASADLTAAAAAELAITKTAPDSLAWPLTTQTANPVGTTISVASTTFLAIGDYVYVCSAADCSTGDAARITAISGTTVTLSAAVTGGNGFAVRPVIPYVITYSNTGNANATNVVLTDPVPAGMVFVAADPAYSSSPPPTWNLGTLAPGEGGSVRLWLMPNALGTYTNTATIDCAETAPVSASAVTGIGALVPSKQETVVVEPIINTPSGGAQATYTLTIANQASVAAHVEVTDTMEKGFTYASTQSSLVNGVATAPDTSYPAVGATPATWCCWTVPAGGVLTISFTADISNEVGTGTYQNDVSCRDTSDQVKSLDFDELATTVDDVDVLWLGPNLALVNGLSAQVEHGSVVLSFSTDGEIATGGFVVERLAGDGWLPVHEGVLPALLDSPRGGVYRLTDPGAPTGGTLTYRIRELEATGATRLHGPFAVRVAGGSGEEWLPAGESFASEQHGDRRGAVGTSPAPDTRPGRIAGLKIGVREAGVYTVTSREIASGLGLTEPAATALISTRGLRLTAGGADVAWTPAAGARGIVFYGQPTDSPFSADNVYVLTRAPGLTMNELAVQPDSTVTGGQTFAATETYEVEATPWLVGPVEPLSDFWYWTSLYTTGQPVSRTLDIEVSGVAAGSGEARLEVALQGGSETVGAQHHVAVLLNGYYLGSDSLSSFEEKLLSFDVDQALLREGGNQVQLVASLEGGLDRSLVYVDRLVLSYQRTYETFAPWLLARADGHESIAMTIGGGGDIRLGRSVLLLEVTEERQPRVVSGASVRSGADGRLVVGLAPSTPDDVYVAVGTTGLRRPAWLRTDRASNLSSTSNRADYLVITTAALREAAETLAQHRASQGLRTMVVDVEDVWDELSNGMPDPRALKDLLRLAARRWQVPPRFVLLAGNGTYDYRDAKHYGDNLLPVLMQRGSWGIYAGDALLGDVTGDDGIPEVAVGRIPAVTGEELAATVARLIAAENAGSPSAALVMADNPDDTGSYTSDSEVLERLLPPGFTVAHALLSELGPEEARAAVLAAVNGSVSLATYVGHAGLTQLASEGLLRSSDLAGLHNQQLPVMALMGCHVGNFAIPGYPSLGVELVMLPRGGAAAVWAPLGLSYNARRVDLAAAFLGAANGQGETLLGDAILRAFESLAQLPEEARRELIGTQVLLGDPATPMPR